MGSSSGCISKRIDSSVGSLVWVCRRNGSWWPGRILGLDELSATSLIPPKSGTPVKLLGRTDASVDWYNLEKSKRVKPFRCGEYEECIEKAKAHVASDNRRAVKYARREDAILQALELEKDRIRSSILCRNSSETARSNGEINGLGDGILEGQEVCQSVISFEEPNCANDDGDDDDDDGMKRMRGLENLGKGKCGNHDDRAQQPSTSGSYFLSGKWRGNLVGCVGVQDLRKRNRGWPLMKVLESTEMASTDMVSVSIQCEELGSPCRSHKGISCPSRSNHRVNVCRTPSDSVFPEQDRPGVLYDVPFVAEEKYASLVEKPQSQGRRVENVTLSKDDPMGNEIGLTGSWRGIETATSMWRSKRKRSVRRRTRRDGNERLSYPIMWRSLHTPNFYVHRRRPKSLLYDVNVEVRVDYRPQHVPLISLMSGLDGKAIVGHALTVELLSDRGKHSKFATSTRKIRRLSSLFRHQEENPGLPRQPSPIPLTVVFSRIHSAFDGSNRNASTSSYL